MYATYLPTDNLDKVIFSEKSDVARLESGDFQGYNLLKKISTGAVFHSPFHAVVQVECKEHACKEYVSSVNYHRDLFWWYEVGRHPRFSIVGALLEAKQRVNEIRMQLARPIGQNGFSLVLREALEKAETPGDFLKSLQPSLFTNLRVNRRVFRVSNFFKEKYNSKSVSVDDFLDERNHELRRLMLRILPIKKVLERMKLVVTDEEGSLYDAEVMGELLRYLYVICPSTSQEYLLEVPFRYWEGGKVIDVSTPKIARRWTFNLGPDSVFAKEA